MRPGMSTRLPIPLSLLSIVAQIKAHSFSCHAVNTWIMRVQFWIWDLGLGTAGYPWICLRIEFHTPLAIIRAHESMTSGTYSNSGQPVLDGTVASFKIVSHA
ncbi:hypothetical protein BDW71DRAFT_87680 [Aspergillus fruticulosus]